MSRRVIGKAGVALAVLVGALGAAPSADLKQSVRTWRAAHDRQIVQELADLVALRNVASNRADIQRNADAMLALLRRHGIEGRLLAAGDAPPAVFAEVMTPGAQRTIVFYAHYDGQPADPADWGGQDPWKPVLRTGPRGPETKDVDLGALATAPSPLPAEWRLYGRSTSDDKAPIVAVLAALDALRAAGIPPSVNVKLFFEGEEEAGSPHLKDILTAHADLLKADCWILADGPVHQSRRMQVVFGARGITDVEMTVYGPVRALHSGHYGNWAPNPAALLVQLLAGLRGPDGEIRIADFYRDVRPLGVSEKLAVAAMPPVEDDLRRELGLAWTEGPFGTARLQDLVMRPALNLRGLQSAQVGKGARNAIPTEASASIDFRLVPDQTPAKVRELTEAHLRKQGFWVVHEEPDLPTRLAHPRIVRLIWGDGYPGARTAMDLPASRAVLRAIETGWGPVLRVPMLGGSVPVYVFDETMKVPVIALPIANHDNNQHAAHENLRLQNLWDGIEIYAALFARLQESWP